MKQFKKITIKDMSELNELSLDGYDVISIYPQSYDFSFGKAVVSSLSVILKYTGKVESDDMYKIVFDKMWEITYGISGQKICKSYTFSECGVDSLDFVDMCINLEREFKIDIDIDEIPIMKTVDEFVKYVVNLIKKKYERND